MTLRIGRFLLGIVAAFLSAIWISGCASIPEFPSASGIKKVTNLLSAKQRKAEIAAMTAAGSDYHTAAVAEIEARGAWRAKVKK